MGSANFSAKIRSHRAFSLQPAQTPHLHRPRWSILETRGLSGVPIVFTEGNLCGVVMRPTLGMSLGAIGVVPIKGSPPKDRLLPDSHY
jgi:hypothetical protein